MTAPTGAYVVRDALVTIATVQYANQCTRASLVPDQPHQTLKTMVPDGIVQDVDTPAWTLQLEMIQDHETGGLARALTDANGTDLALILEPNQGAGKRSAACTVTAKAVEFGGTQGEWATATVELPVTGQPVFTNPA
jgi:hypothetical protein